VRTADSEQDSLAPPFWRRTFWHSAVSAQDVLAQPQANNAININMRCLFATISAS